MTCINSVTVTPKALTLKVGDWYYYASAEVSPSDADCTDVVWHSNNPNVASVNESTGYIYANSLGTANIYATATDGSECSDYITVTVNSNIPVTSISLNTSSLSIEEDTSDVLVATVAPSNASNKSVTWSSDNEHIAYVGEDGTVCGISTGDTYITATSTSNPNISARCLVTVTGDVLVRSISIRLDEDVVDENNNINIGNSFFARAIITPTDATNPNVCWSSSNSSVATVISNSGLVSALAEGSAVITATACDSGRIFTRVAINVVRAASTTSITIDPSSRTIVLGAYTSLQAIIEPFTASNSVRWSSTNEAVATVNATGGVTGIAPGTTTIRATATDGSNVYGDCTLTVITLPEIGNEMWWELGFKYSNSEKDCLRESQGFPPFAYEQWVRNGRHKIIYLCAHDDIPVVGHALLLIRGDDGGWFKTQFRGTTPTDSFIECIPISEERKDEYLVQEKMHHIILCGNYRGSLETAKSIAANPNNDYNGKWNLLNNNCLHYVNEILSQGTNIHESINEYVRTNNRDAPHAYYEDLINILNQ
ncbi:MAG: hypothetical protein E7653_02085 [Ruminococcaceae bacterium]|nr:hypothetical protein [Oscillospiraceae bacterium]